MMDEQGTRFEVLLEDMKTHLSAVAESNHALAAALADMKADSSRRFDEIDVKLVGMTIEMRDLKAEVGTLGGKVDKLEAFASDAGPRLVRLEGKVDKLEAFANDAAPRLVRLEGQVDKVEAFASDAAPRLVRIETHLALPAPRPRREIKPSKHHRRKPTKRN
jgi:chromosome segregation ATPase